MNPKRIHVFYSGHVQGVGFRYTAQDIASLLDLKGWVRNLRDGQVELVCEGEEEKLKIFLKRIRESFISRYIKDSDVIWEGPTGEFDRFDIKF